MVTENVCQLFNGSIISYFYELKLTGSALYFTFSKLAWISQANKPNPVIKNSEIQMFQFEKGQFQYLKQISNKENPIDISPKNY